MSETAGRRELLKHGRNVLFVYGTLQFDRVLEALLGRIPARTPASAPGWRAAALEGRVYPGLVPTTRSGAASGLLLTDLSREEWEILDAFEHPRYELREVTLAAGECGWVYIWPGGEVCPEDWDADEFESRHLKEYAARCARIGPRLAAGLPKGE